MNWRMDVISKPRLVNSVWTSDSRYNGGTYRSTTLRVCSDGKVKVWKGMFNSKSFDCTVRKESSSRVSRRIALLVSLAVTCKPEKIGNNSFGSLLPVRHCGVAWAIAWFLQFFRCFWWRWGRGSWRLCASYYRGLWQRGNRKLSKSLGNNGVVYVWVSKDSERSEKKNKIFAKRKSLYTIRRVRRRNVHAGGKKGRKKKL